MDNLYWGDFYALCPWLHHKRKMACKFPYLVESLHGCLKNHMARDRCELELMPPTQFALWVRSSALHVLWVTHQHILNQRFHGLTVYFV